MLYTTGSQYFVSKTVEVNKSKNYKNKLFYRKNNPHTIFNYNSLPADLS